MVERQRQRAGQQGGGPSRRSGRSEKGVVEGEGVARGQLHKGQVNNAEAFAETLLGHADDASSVEDTEDLLIHEGSESGDDSGGDNDDEESVYDSGDDVQDGEESGGPGDDDSDDSFEDQGSSSDESEVLEQQGDDSDDEGDDVEYLQSEDDEGVGAEGDQYIVDDSKPRAWKATPTLAGRDRDRVLDEEKKTGALDVAKYMHVDDLSSDDEEEGMRNRIGRVPLHWYDEFDHIGYDVKGEKLMSGKRLDGLDQALASRDDPNYYRTVYDAVNDRHVVLSDRDLELIRRMQRGAFAHPEFDAYAPQIDVYCDKEEIFGSDKPEPKRRFIPSKWELMKVHKLVKAIKEGRIKVQDPNAPPEDKKEAYYMLWKDEEDEEERKRKKGPMAIPAPKLPLPGHAESYNPPLEYLPTEEEIKEWEELDPSDRPLSFIPRKFNSLRQVCAYKDFVKERFERCLDLYLCPRALRKKPEVDPDSMLPKLPNPRDLQPFPTTKAMEFVGHRERVRTLAVSHDGQFVASGSDDGTVRLWETSTGYCLKTWDVGGRVMLMQWNPSRGHHVVAVAAGHSVFLIATDTGGQDERDITSALLASGLEAAGGADQEKSAGVSWEAVKGKGWDAQGSGHVPGVVLRLPGEATYVTWHSKGDYVATVVPTAGARAVMIHQVSKGRTQCPFRKTHGQVQAVAFHPSKPFFFVATQTHIRVYHLLKQVMVKKLLSGCKWISSIDVHPTGDHVIVSSYDRRVVWFDLDLSSMAYKTLKYHTKAVRCVKHHRSYPLMASASDDGTVHIFHCKVYDDLMTNPLIVPVKILRGHHVVKDIGVMGLVFHPTQPWLFSCGADGKVLLYQDLC